MQRSAHYRHRVVTGTDVAFVRKRIAEHPRASRRTTGRGKNAWSKRPNRPIKEVLGYPLRRDFRQLLRV